MTNETTYKVMIIEDDESILLMYKRKLEIEGFIVCISMTGLNILDLVNTERPDVILIDIMMPGINGFTVLESIKQNITYPVKTVIFSNLSRPEDIERAKTLGADDFFIKANLMPKELANKLKLLLAK